jgi:hypothetical protein
MVVAAQKESHSRRRGETFFRHYPNPADFSI